ncbi:energy transducer TonB [Vibrio vulnificus]|uniref:energy transducer TonB n=1 Tax=Vibrio vulnificus TaxID=672 RepID=UPI0009B63FE0|nr:energy transducer TonB [Vibrio vulnificus]ELX4205615.1 energy transducer TonB [Vibrio vulnificus]OQK45267.1 periplasmic protein TonB2 [Vibrio vulnificus]
MMRLVIAFPVALALVFALFSAMALLVNSGKKQAIDQTPSLSFNMVMVEQDTEVTRRQRSVPPPPEIPEPPQPETPKMAQTPMQVTSTQVATPNIDMRFNVSGLAVSIPATVSAPTQNATNTTKQLMPLSRVEVVYPAKAKKRRIEGYVILKFDIDETGRTKNIEVVEAQPARFFERNAMDAIKRWRYQPQIVDGQAQTIYGYTTKIEFKMAQ